MQHFFLREHRGRVTPNVSRQLVAMPPPGAPSGCGDACWWLQSCELGHACLQREHVCGLQQRIGQGSRTRTGACRRAGAGGSGARDRSRARPRSGSTSAASDHHFWSISSPAAHTWLAQACAPVRLGDAPAYLFGTMQLSGNGKCLAPRHFSRELIPSLSARPFRGAAHWLASLSDRGCNWRAGRGGERDSAMPPTARTAAPRPPPAIPACPGPRRRPGFRHQVAYSTRRPSHA